MDWSTFDRKIRIAAPCSSVYQAWVDRTQISIWFLASCIQVDPVNDRTIVRKGDIVEWSWHNYPNPSKITILEANGLDSIVFTLGYGMEVSITLLQEQSWTVVHLQQYNIPTDEESKKNFHVGCRQAWSTWLLNLKAWLEHSIVLHDQELGKRKDLFDFVNT